MECLLDRQHQYARMGGREAEKLEGGVESEWVGEDDGGEGVQTQVALCKSVKGELGRVRFNQGLRFYQGTSVKPGNIVLFWIQILRVCHESNVPLKQLCAKCNKGCCGCKIIGPNFFSVSILWNFSPLILHFWSPNYTRKNIWKNLIIGSSAALALLWNLNILKKTSMILFTTFDITNISSSFIHGNNIAQYNSTHTHSKSAALTQIGRLKRAHWPLKLRPHIFHATLSPTSIKQ